MSRTFAYCRTSTTVQETENQALAIAARGFDIPQNRIIEEQISGGVCAMARPAFRALVEHKLESGDRLVVLRLDRLGRDSIDVQQTITMLMARGVKVISLDLPVSDLTTAEGRLMLQMFAAFAEFEKARIIERTREGLARARKQGRTGGRPRTAHAGNIARHKADGLSQRQAADALGISLSTIKRYWNREA